MSMNQYQPQEPDENDDRANGIERDADGKVFTVKGHTMGYWQQRILAERDFMRDHKRIARYNIRGRSEEAAARIQACEWNIAEFEGYVNLFD